MSAVRPGAARQPTPAAPVARLLPWLGARLPLPRGLFGRLLALLLALLAVSHVLALTLMFELMPPPGPPPDAFADRPLAPHADGSAFPPPGAPFAGRPPPPPGDRPPPPHFPPGLLLDIGVRAAAVALGAWIGARWLTAPIRRLAQAAGELGADLDSAPLADDTGPAEAREAARGFNAMQARLREQRDERRRFVAAVSHDLRTPLTRLRLRSEALADAAERERFRRDIAEMDAMIGATLDHLRGDARPEAFAPLDLAALLAALADDEADCGRAVRLAGAESDAAAVARAAADSSAPRYLVHAQPVALRRCVANLVENALRYGGCARLGLTRDAAGAVVVEVADDGPGIAPERIEAMFEPFVRGEASRNRGTGGVGLGLAIARDIARRHGGTLLLRNAPAGGLVATLALPALCIDAGTSGQ
ncbi:ATP-binding protein [Derxia lacustris]|uniref:ATP-binding protein n=1 Tax=Derxia lacustris TaxID=764842 RepID=UPI001F45C353|nr:ATP-binding protein [Derxia lacustris]